MANGKIQCMTTDLDLDSRLHSCEHSDLLQFLFSTLEVTETKWDELLSAPSVRPSLCTKKKSL